MFIVLNGPLGIGESTLAEALCESIDHCVMLDGDHVVAANPSHPDAQARADLRRSLSAVDSAGDVRCFLLAGAVPRRMPAGAGVRHRHSGQR